MTKQEFSSDQTVAESRNWIEQHISEGVICPSCDRIVKQYTRSINRAQALAMIGMYIKKGINYTVVRDLKSKYCSGNAYKNNEISKLAHWGLVKQNPDSKLPGQWRITSKGEKWLRGEITVKSKVIIYQAESKGFGREETSLIEVISTKAPLDFDLDGTITEILGMTRLGVEEESSKYFNEETISKRLHRVVPYKDSFPGYYDEYEDYVFSAMSEVSLPTLDGVSDKIYSGGETVSEAHEWVMNNLSRGVYCPSCDRIAVMKRYHMKDHMARLLIEMYRHHGLNPVDVREFYLDDVLVDHQIGIGGLSHRNLVAPVPVAGDGTGGSGWYSVTDAGVEWIFNRAKATVTVESYNYYSITRQDSRLISITEVLRNSDKWNYRSLMEGFSVAPAEDDDVLFAL